MEDSCSLDKRRERLAADTFAAGLGVELLEVSEGYSRARLRLSSRHLNFNGAVHGAVIFALADAVFAAASNSHEEICAATHVSIDFLRAPRPEDELVAECRENLLGRKAGHYTMQVKDASGETVALCQGWVYRSSRLHED